jgi:hypothetical protein
MKWEKTGDDSAKSELGANGRRGSVMKLNSGWQGSVSYPDGPTEHSPYYTTETTAKKWVERKINGSKRERVQKAWYS